MRYRIVAAGGNAPPTGYRQTADTAGEALSLLAKIRALFDRAQAVVEDEHGRPIDEGDLRRRAADEAVG